MVMWWTNYWQQSLSALTNWVGSVSAYLSISTTVEGNDELVVCYPQDGTRTALIVASEYGHLQIVKKLIKAGAMVEQQNKVGTHPVTYHAETQIIVRAVVRGAHE